MFIRLCLADAGAFYVNADQARYFGKSGNVTEVHFVDREIREVRETPAEILALLAGDQK